MSHLGNPPSSGATALSLYPSFFGPGGRISPPPHSVLKWIEWKLKNLGVTAPTTRGVNWNPGSKQQLWKMHHTKTGAKVSLSPLVPFFASCSALLARTQQQINNSWYQLTRHLSDRLVHRYMGRSRSFVTTWPNELPFGHNKVTCNISIASQPGSTPCSLCPFRCYFAPIKKILYSGGPRSYYRAWIPARTTTMR